MEQFISKSLADIVNEKSKTASVFEKYQLDYCCKGKRSLQQACTEQHVPVDEIVADLKQIYSEKQNEIDFRSLNLCELSDYIVTKHHSYVKKEMPQIMLHLRKVVTKHALTHIELFRISDLFNELSIEKTTHLQKEEEVIFPAIKVLEESRGRPVHFNEPQSVQLALPVVDLVNEHEHAGDIMSEINELTDNYTAPADGCTTFKLLYASLMAFELDLHHHVHMENSILFPKALIAEQERLITIHNYASSENHNIF